MSQNFTTTFSVDQSPEDVFAAINNVPAWWSEIEGTTDEVGGEFLYQVADIHRCRIRVTELIPGERVVWLILENYLHFTRAAPMRGRVPDDGVPAEPADQGVGHRVILASLD